MNLRPRLALLFAVAFFASTGATLLTLGFFYFTAGVWGWNAKLNLSLAAAMNVAYVVSSLSAHAISTKLGRRKSLLVIYALMTACCAAASVAPTHLLVSSCLLVYMFFTGMTWPMLESLCSQTPDAHAMSRRVGAYNLTWAAAGVIAVWIAGGLIEHWKSGMFLLPVMLHGSTVVIMLLLLVRERDGQAQWEGEAQREGEAPSEPKATCEKAPREGEAPSEPLRSTGAGSAKRLGRSLALPFSRDGSGGNPPPSVAFVKATPARTDRPPIVFEPEPELIQSRTLALWLSRIALPAMYVVNYALGAILPTLAIMQQFTPTRQTLLGSIWIVARMVAFAILGATAFWHTRPRLLLLSSLGLLVAFLLTTLAGDLPTMIGGQILLGIAMAIIYTGSLYFGMVLSAGSTEHSGYHEALIGLGGILGPGAGALTQYFCPGQVKIAIGAVGGIVALSVLCAAGASIRLRSPARELEH